MVRHLENQPELKSKAFSREDYGQGSGSESETQKESLRKQKSCDYSAEEKKNSRYKGSYKVKGNSDNEQSSHLPPSMGARERKIEEAYSSSVGSTKDRDHSNSSSVNSKNDTDDVRAEVNTRVDLNVHEYNFICFILSLVS